jgi:FMN-dependent NADH-azoreductase
MSVLLAIEASPRLENSISRRLTERFIERWQTAHAGGTVLRRDLMKTRLRFIDQDWIGGVFTPPERRSPKMREALRRSDELIAELMGADHVVIGTPIFNGSIPAVLKAYIDQIVRVGETVTPEFQGTVTGKRATVIVAAGGGESWDGATGYLKHILGFLGIRDVSAVLAQRTLAVDRGQTTMADFAARFEEDLAQAACG